MNYLLTNKYIQLVGERWMHSYHNFRCETGFSNQHLKSKPCEASRENENIVQPTENKLTIGFIQIPTRSRVEPCLPKTHVNSNAAMQPLSFTFLFLWFIQIRLAQAISYSSANSSRIGKMRLRQRRVTPNLMCPLRASFLRLFSIWIEIREKMFERMKIENEWIFAIKLDESASHATSWLPRIATAKCLRRN